MALQIDNFIDKRPTARISRRERECLFVRPTRRRAQRSAACCVGRRVLVARSLGCALSPVTGIGISERLRSLEPMASLIFRAIRLSDGPPSLYQSKPPNYVISRLLRSRSAGEPHRRQPRLPLALRHRVPER